MFIKSGHLTSGSQVRLTKAMLCLLVSPPTMDKCLLAVCSVP